MKLREQIKREGYYSLITEEETNEIEKVADNFAIGFVNWCQVKFILSSLDCHLTTKQLLEMYKKEKNL